MLRFADSIRIAMLAGLVGSGASSQYAFAQDSTIGQSMRIKPSSSRPVITSSDDDTSTNSSTSNSAPMRTQDMHHAGMWMFEYRYMHMAQDGMLQKAKGVEPASLINNPDYLDANGEQVMMVPTDMTMDMHMFMGMFDVTNKLTVMAMGNFAQNNMNMIHDASAGGHAGHTGAASGLTTMNMTSSGLGDTQVGLMYKLDEVLLYNPILNVTLSIPTGSIDQEDDAGNVLPYDMQLGSGTYDLYASLAMSNKFDMWDFGYEAGYLYHMCDNEQNYCWGNKLQLDAWLRYSFDFGTKVRAMITHAKWDTISGEDTRISASTDFAANPDYYGGMRSDLVLRATQDFPWGLTGLVQVGVPLHQSLDGFQLKTVYTLQAGVQWMFM